MHSYLNTQALDCVLETVPKLQVFVVLTFQVFSGLLPLQSVHTSA